MKIQTVELTNFRQFYGSQKIEFSTDPQKNVTLIHAENGFGKTTILNSILWALFDQLTAKFEDPQVKINFEALEEGISEAKVEVGMLFKSLNYLVVRRVDKLNKSKLEAFKIIAGRHEPLNAPETFINSVVPSEMAKYFFFDGEAAEAYSSATNYEAIGKAIRSILGCELAETAIEDLKETCKSIDKELRKIPGEDEIHDIEEEISKIEDELENHLRLKEKLEDEIANYTKERSIIDKKLHEMEAAKEIHTARTAKEEQLSNVRQDIKATIQEIVKWVGNRSIQVVGRRLAQETFEFINEASLKGKIPSPYNEEFVKGLLDDEICICHRPLKPGSEEWVAVAELLKNASNAEIMGRVVRARARASVFSEESGDASKTISDSKKKLGSLTAKYEKLEQEVAELSKKLENVQIDEIAERERARRNLDSKILDNSQKLGGVKGKINQLETNKRIKEEELQKAGQKNKQARRLLLRRELLVRSGEVLKRLLESYEDEARKNIQEEINKILGVVAHKDYECRINPNFSIELVLSKGRRSPKSGGENQLLSLVFIASLIKFAASRINDDNLILKPGTVAPLVIDAPLGQLDTTYRASFGEYIPKLAEQIILLLSSGQADPEVLEALEPYIGAEYLLFSENKGPRGQRPEVHRSIRGKDYIVTLFNQSRNMTRIERIK